MRQSEDVAPEHVVTWSPVVVRTHTSLQLADRLDRASQELQQTVRQNLSVARLIPALHASPHYSGGFDMPAANV